MCKCKYDSGDWRWRMETFSSVVVSSPPWFGSSNQKYSFLMTVQGPVWKESVVSVTASKQTHIWRVPQQRPMYLPAKPRKLDSTWFVGKIWSVTQQHLSPLSLLLLCFTPVLNPVKMRTAIYKLLLACLSVLVSETKPNYHNSFLDIFFWLSGLSTALISRA